MVELPGPGTTRERRAGGKIRDLAHEGPPLGLGTDGTRNLMTLLGELQMAEATLCGEDQR
jgi:hypothetical protein